MATTPVKCATRHISQLKGIPVPRKQKAEVPASFRFKKADIDLLKRLMANSGESQVSVMRRALRKLARSEGVTLTT